MDTTSVIKALQHANDMNMLVLLIVGGLLILAYIVHRITK